MTDTVVKKTILNEIHDLVAEAAHLVLVPVVAALEGTIAVLSRFLVEVQKF